MCSTQIHRALQGHTVRPEITYATAMPGRCLYQQYEGKPTGIHHTSPGTEHQTHQRSTAACEGIRACFSRTKPLVIMNSQSSSCVQSRTVKQQHALMARKAGRRKKPIPQTIPNTILLCARETSSSKLPRLPNSGGLQTSSRNADCDHQCVLRSL